ncbi:UNVERIFIED_CONTAM: hypothetical protein K2H54_036590 [Gekko kuhli]
MARDKKPHPFSVLSFRESSTREIKKCSDLSFAAIIKMSNLAFPTAGYSGPLKEVPHEKFNSTAIPKAYQCPWREFLSSEDYQVDSETRLPEPPKKVNIVDRSFNRTPTPFGGLLLNDVYPVPGFEMNEAQTDDISSLELMLNRPSFNRAPQGWVLAMPESEEL